MASVPSTHTIVEQLQKFRYVATTRECPLKEVRGVDLGDLRVRTPDLQMLKHLTSCLSDCALPSLMEVQSILSPSEILQLLGVYQALLQFSLHSQAVLRHQVSAKQTAISVEKITTQQVSALEARLELAKKKLEDAATERQAAQITFHNMEKQIVELRTANGLIERELEFHRNTQRLITASKSAEVPSTQQQLQQQAGVNSGAEPRHLVNSAPSNVARPVQSPNDTSVEAKPRKSKLRSARHATTSDSTSSEERHGHRQRSSSRGTMRRTPSTNQYVDWQTFASMLMSQQQQQQQTGSNPLQQVPAVSATSPRTTPAPAEQSDAAARAAAAHEKHMSDVIKALNDGLDNNREQILKQTQESIGSIEAGIVHRMTKLQHEQRAMQQELASKVHQSEQQWSNAVGKLSAQLASLKEDTDAQMRLLKEDVNTAISSVSRQTSVANNITPPPMSHQQHTQSSNASAQQSNQRSMSPNVLPPLPLTQMQQDLNASNAGTAKHQHQGSPVGTPGSVFGPRVLSATVSHSGDRNSSDDEGDDSPYVPMSKQQAARTAVPVATPTSATPQAAAMTAAAAVSALSTPLAEPTMNTSGAGGLDTSANLLTRKASSQLLKDTQDELQRLLEEEAAAERAKMARLAAAADK